MNKKSIMNYLGPIALQMGITAGVIITKTIYYEYIEPEVIKMNEKKYKPRTIGFRAEPDW